MACTTVGRVWRQIRGMTNKKAVQKQEQLARVGDGGGRRILFLDDVALRWGEDGWIGIALVKLFDLGGGSASPGIVADRHQGDVEIP